LKNEWKVVKLNSFIVASTGIIAGNRHDAFNLKQHLQTTFKSMKRLNIPNIVFTLINLRHHLMY